MMGRERYPKDSLQRPRTREKIKDFCRTVVAFMCTQVGVGALVLGYTIVGAISFMYVEAKGKNTKVKELETLRLNYTHFLYVNVVEVVNVIEKEKYVFEKEMNNALKIYQDQVVELFRHGYDERTMGEIWTFPAALMFSLSIITMIGYGNLVPQTSYGKIATVIYALFGIPLFILYFLNVGDGLASGFRWIYTKLYECSTQRNEEERKKIIVPSTACLWAICAYVLTGAILFTTWERWDFLDSIYFCVTSLCKLGFGDLVPGANVYASNHGNQTKLVINFGYILFGMGLVAMCFNLMREEIKEKVREMREDFAQCLEDTRVKLMLFCHRLRGVQTYN